MLWVIRTSFFSAAGASAAAMASVSAIRVATKIRMQLAPKCEGRPATRGANPSYLERREKLPARVDSSHAAHRRLRDRQPADAGRWFREPVPQRRRVRLPARDRVEDARLDRPGGPDGPHGSAAVHDVRPQAVRRQPRGEL